MSFHKQTLYGCEGGAETPSLHIKAYLWDGEWGRVGLEQVSIKIGFLLDTESDFLSFITHATSFFDLGVSVSAIVTDEADEHNFFEEGDAREAHLDMAHLVTIIARYLKSRNLLSRVIIGQSVLVILLIDGLTKVYIACIGSCFVSCVWSLWVCSDLRQELFLLFLSLRLLLRITADVVMVHSLVLVFLFV